MNRLCVAIISCLLLLPSALAISQESLDQINNDAIFVWHNDINGTVSNGSLETVHGTVTGLPTCYGSGQVEGDGYCDYDSNGGSSDGHYLPNSYISETINNTILCFVGDMASSGMVGNEAWIYGSNDFVPHYDGRASTTVEYTVQGKMLSYGASKLYNTDGWQMTTHTVSWDGANINISAYINGTWEADLHESLGSYGKPGSDFYMGRYHGNNYGMRANMDFCAFFNRSLMPDQVAFVFDEISTGASFPFPAIAASEITSYNLTSEGGFGCTSWNTEPSTACVTEDSTPSVSIETADSASCAIGVQDLNYTDMMALAGNRSCYTIDGQSHSCTLHPNDALGQGSNQLYIGCVGGNGIENRTSTSDALAVQFNSVTYLTSTYISSGVSAALNDEYELYSNQKLYSRTASDVQKLAVFDVVAKWKNKIWAFNSLEENESSTGMVNITPVLYVLDLTDGDYDTINQTVYDFVIATK